jgi:hypothetical protein
MTDIELFKKILAIIPKDNEELVRQVEQRVGIKREYASDKEYYLDYWTPTVGKEEAEKSWEVKEKGLKRVPSMVMSDIGGYVSQIDGSYIESRSKHRDHLKRHGMIELGNDVPKNIKSIELSRKSQEERKRTIAEVTYEKLRYK